MIHCVYYQLWMIYFTSSVFKQLGQYMPAVLVRDLLLGKIHRFFSSAGCDYC